MRVLVAFDKFKGSLTALEACAAGARAVESCGHAAAILPLSDGGEGFARILTTAAAGRLIRVPARGPRGELVDAEFGLVDSASLTPEALTYLGVLANAPARIGVVELAAASGLQRVSIGERDPRQMTTRGTGDLLLAAVEAGCDAVVVGLGGSATHDLGLGVLAACGFRFLDVEGKDLGDPRAVVWSRLGRIVPHDRRFPVPVILACDVDNPLLGPRGAARVFAQQKGLPADEVESLDHASAAVVSLMARDLGVDPRLVDVPGAGAAGGTAFGLMAGLGARLVSGFDLFAAWLGVDRGIAAADVVVTGEGSFDRGSLGGKGPCGLAIRAAAAGRRTAIFAGRVEVGIGHSLAGVEVFCIHGSADDPHWALAEAAPRLERSVRSWLVSVAEFEARPHRDGEPSSGS